MEWDSPASAARDLSLSRSGIVRACKGELKTCGNFRWSYVEDRAPEDIGDEQVMFLYGIVPAGMETLGRWRTIRAAARDLGVDSSLVCKVANAKRFSWDGVVFVWAETVDEARVLCIERAISRIS
jgi:hypothetical protein